MSHVLQLNRVLAKQGFATSGINLSTNVEAQRLKSLASGETRTKLSKFDLAELNRQLALEGFPVDTFNLSTLVDHDIVKSLGWSEARQKLGDADLTLVTLTRCLFVFCCSSNPNAPSLPHSCTGSYLSRGLPFLPRRIRLMLIRPFHWPVRWMLPLV